MPLQPRALILITVFVGLAGWVAYDATHRDGGDGGAATKVARVPSTQAPSNPAAVTPSAGAPASATPTSSAPASESASSASPSGGAAPSYAATFTAKQAALSQALPVRPELTALSTDPFGPRSWRAAPPAAAGSSAHAEAAAPQPPTAPPMPFRFVGRLDQNGEVQYFVARGNDVFTVNVGDTLAGDYKVQSIDNTRMTMVYLPARQKQTLELDSALYDDTAVAGIPLPGALPSTSASASTNTPDKVSNSPSANASASASTSNGASVGDSAPTTASTRPRSSRRTAAAAQPSGGRS